MSYLETDYDHEILEIWEDNFRSYLKEHITDVNYDVCEALWNLAYQHEDELFGQGTSLAEDW